MFLFCDFWMILNNFDFEEIHKKHAEMFICSIHTFIFHHFSFVPFEVKYMYWTFFHSAVLQWTQKPPDCWEFCEISIISTWTNRILLYVLKGSVADGPVGFWRPLCIQPPTPALYERTRHVDGTSNWALNQQELVPGIKSFSAETLWKEGVKRKSLNIHHFQL